ncbi:MAG: peptidylprolyl isomerase [Acetobacteraceae bacterium]
MNRVAVDGVAIDEHAIAAEMQLHPAARMEDAWTEAARALVIRHLLLIEAGRAGIEPDPPEPDEGPEEVTIRALLAEHVVVPEPDEATCRAHWQVHRNCWRSPVVYEAAHILFAAAPEDAAARAQAKQAATETLAILSAHPERFAALARARSACSSAAQGGLLGQQRRGDLVAEIETFVMALEPGALCPVPIATRYGYHVLRLDRRADGAPLPYEAAAAAVRRDLAAHAWQRATAAYLHALAARARIEGIRL